MAISKIFHQNSRPHLKNVLEYIIRPDKTEGGRWVGMQNCLNPYQDMLATKKLAGKVEGRQGYHLVISFAPEDEKTVTPEIALQIVEEFCHMYVPDYEALYSVHTETDHTHCHLVWNSVTSDGTHKYHYAAKEWQRQIQPIVNRLCAKYGLLTLQFEEPAKTDRLTHKEWEAKQAGHPIRQDFYRADLDDALHRAAMSGRDRLEAVAAEMKKKGYDIRLTGTCMTLYPPGGKKGIRSGRLGEEYSLEHLKDRLAEVVTLYRSRNQLQLQTSAGSKIQSPHIQQATVHCDSVGMAPAVYRIRVRTCIRIAGGASAIHFPNYGSAQTWQKRADALRLSRLLFDYHFLTDNQIHGVRDIQQLQRQYQAQYRLLQQKTKKLKKTIVLKNTQELIQQLQQTEQEKKILWKKISCCKRLEQEYQQALKQMEIPAWKKGEEDVRQECSYLGTGAKRDVSDSGNGAGDRDPQSALRNPDDDIRTQEQYQRGYKPIS